MISHLGPQLGIADGIALAAKLRKEKKSTIVFTGDGGASEAAYHQETIDLWNKYALDLNFIILRKNIFFKRKRCRNLSRAKRIG